MVEKEPCVFVAGTYERTLCGFELDDAAGLKAIFNAPAHLGPVKAVAASGKWLASGGTDEEIRIFNIGRRVEFGSLMRHQRPITTLRFHSTSHLVSGSDDGEIIVWRSKDWECLLNLRGHTGGVVDLDVHPSGRVLLSCSRDSTLRLWDLTRGKQLHSSIKSFGKTLTIPAEHHFVKWGPAGDNFALSCGNTVSIFDPEGSDARAICSLVHSRQPLAAAFVDQHTLATGGEDGIVRLWDVRSGKESNSLQTMGSRIRAVVWDSQGENLCSASSGGDIRTFKLTDLSATISLVETRARITCAAVSSRPFQVSTSETKGDSDEAVDDPESHSEEDSSEKKNLAGNGGKGSMHRTIMKNKKGAGKRGFGPGASTKGSVKVSRNGKK